MILFLMAPQMKPDSVQQLGPYRAIRWRHDDIGRVVLKDRHGRVLAQVSDFNAEARPIGDVDGDGLPETCLWTWSGGAHASFSYTIVSLGSMPRCLVSYWKGNGEGDASDLIPKDLDGDGRPELVSWYDGFAYRLGGGYAPLQIPLILKLRHGRFVEATSDFPGFVRVTAHHALERLQALARSPVDDGWQAPRHQIELRIAATDFLARKMLLGEEETGLRAARPFIDPATFGWMSRNRRWIRGVVEDRKRRVRHPLLRDLPLASKRLDSSDSDPS